MLVVVYLLVGLAIVRRQTREEAGEVGQRAPGLCRTEECGGFEAVVLILLWPLYLLYLVMEWVGESVIKKPDE
jgi:hypothetical protein